MRTKRTILALTFVADIVLGPIVALGVETARQGLLSDGFVLRAIDGKVKNAVDSDKWFFEFGVATSDGTGFLEAGTSLELLPSLALEKMTGDTEKRPETSYRLWARVTKYRSSNFLFPIYFVPLSKTPGSAVSPSEKASQEPESIVSEPNDALTIPQEILKKLRTRQVARPRRPDKRKAENEKQEADRRDSVLIDRTGFLSSCVTNDASPPEKADIQHDFVLDALGGNVRQIRLRLLPTQTLELAEYRQSVQPDPVRFKVAGILTEYKGEKYLLLHRATRVYSHGNFGH